MSAPVEQVAALLRDAAASGRPCPPVRDRIADADIATAYAVQKRNVEIATASGGRIVGRKIGLTSPAVQKQLGVDQPDFGTLLAAMAIPDGAEIPVGMVLQPRVEAEIAFVLDRDVTETGLTVADIVRSIAFALPAIEVVGSRIADWDIGIVDTIADNASAGAFVLGGSPRLLRDLDLRGCGMRLDHRGEPVSTGAGAACLGHPLNAVLWLAEALIRQGEGLRAGDIVLSGALGPMVAATPGEVYEARISGLGSVRAVFGEARA
ncbi:4-oxalocrotonate decarboxylase [Rhizorhabdus wittichii RW1]|uniref:4-oxalocrotonate decarboxylase n=1 Tax=Rhizorhabdus wittichii (strain DSM 6014 / CCUG 31198 / JCM 15750 / NBRC 105917 / EY 4224 / RW1) TaxID=392499 RepID=A0A9J9HDN4_RHIWR|nr:4-oxalocrotonate decarboxylase [Rhizorhabdus wittichii RW1]